MEQQLSTPTPETEVQQHVCINCGNPEILKGYPNALCAACREKYIKYPIPFWVKAFGGAILLVIIFSLFSLPKNFSAAIDYERAVKAENEKNFVTAEILEKNVTRTMPGYLEAKAHLLIDAYYNGDMTVFSAAAQDISGKKIDDDDLLSKANHTMDLSHDLYPSDEFITMVKEHGDSLDNIPDTTFKKFIAKNPDDAFAQYLFATILDREKNYSTADSILQELLRKNPENIVLLAYEGGLKRVMGDTKSSMDCYDRLLSLNRQSVSAYAGKARTFLKLQQPAQGLKFALDAFNIDTADGYTIATLVMAYHFNNMIKERDALIKQTQQSKDSTASEYLTYALDVINNRDKL